VFDLVWRADVLDHVDFYEWHGCGFDGGMGLRIDGLMDL
jgi:hypothetical protein